VSRRTLVALAAASALIATPFAALAATNTSGMTTNLAGLAPMRLAGVTDLGAARDAAMRVDVVLAPRNAQAIDALIASRKTVTAAQYDARFAPTAAAAATVTRWADAQGLTARVAPGRTMVELTGSTRAVAKAFGVTFHTFRVADGTTFRANATQARLPQAVAGVASAVAGLSDVSLRTPQHALKTRPSATITVGASYGPQDFWNLYHAPAAATGSGQNLTIITAGDISQAKSDLPLFEDHFGLPHIPFNEIHVGAPSTDASGALEWDLDSQYSTGFAPGAASLTSYTATSLANTDILPTISQWVTDNSNRQASFSAGECELLAVASGFTAALNPVLQRADAQGQSLFVASGDAGSQCSAVIGVNGVPVGIPDVEFPASSPYAVAVGGTTIYATDPTSEIAWYAGGGGTSLLKAGAWQHNAGGTYLAQGGRRGSPDVALDADPNSGYICVIAGAVTPGVGGTSASAPSWQGIWARAQGAHGSALGFASPLLYTIAASSFHDIKIGSNGLFPAAPGWDYTTGRGTPDITLVVNRV
jgi:subtilase family serine protease